MKVEDLLEWKFKDIMDYCDKRELCDNNMGDYCPLIFICVGDNNDNDFAFYAILERIKESKSKTIKFKSKKKKKKTIIDRLKAI